MRMRVHRIKRGRPWMAAHREQRADRPEAERLWQLRLVQGQVAVRA